MDPKRRRRRRRPLHKRVRRSLKRALARTLAWLAPLVYAGYMALVWRTSRVLEHGIEEGKPRLPRDRGFAALFWHEEVVAAPYVYRQLGFRAHVLIARGGPGEVASAVAESMGHTVTRGGTSARRSRHRPLALKNLIRDLQADPGGILAVLVDGPSGPRYRMKPGPLLVARECGMPVVLLRVWFRRCRRLETWDRAAIPLPFNEIHVHAEGPFEVPADADERTGLNRFRRKLERDLIELAARSHRELGQALPKQLQARLRRTEPRDDAPAMVSESG